MAVNRPGSQLGWEILGLWVLTVFSVSVQCLLKHRHAFLSSSKQPSCLHGGDFPPWPPAYPGWSGKGAFTSTPSGNAGFPERKEMLKSHFLAGADLCYFSDFIKIKCVNSLSFHPGVILERKHILKLNRKTIMKDGELTFVKWLCALAKKCMKSTLWTALRDFLCLDFRSNLTDTDPEGENLWILEMLLTKVMQKTAENNFNIVLLKVILSSEPHYFPVDVSFPGVLPSDKQTQACGGCGVFQHEEGGWSFLS